MIAMAMLFFLESTVQAEPGWLPVVVAKEPLKSQIKATPIEMRQNRPLHFYGNTKRRIYYRGNPWPTANDFRMTIISLRAAIRSR